MPIANDMKNIAEGIEVSYGERVAFLSDLSKETDETLKTFNREHKKMAGDLEDFLSSDRANREDTVASLRGKNKRELRAMAEQLANNLRESTSATKKETGSLLSSFHASHEEMARTLRNLLSSDHRKLKFSVGETRSANRSDQRQAREHWRSLTRILAAKRVGKAVTVAKRIEGIAKEEVAEAVEAFTAGSLKEHILRLISETASGMKLAKMGAILRVPYIRLAKPASDLIKEGKIEKAGSKYRKV